MRRFLAAAALGGAVGAIILTGGPASANPASAVSQTAVATAAAADEFPCGAPFNHPRSGDLVQNCPDWAPGSIPVHLNTDQNSEVVGRISPAGDDWYVCQQPGGHYRLGGLENNWWAFTMADNGRLGWVNEVYFRGGDNNERDAGLTVCQDF